MNDTKLNCAITQDLLPLYCDKQVSPQTAKAIEAHLAACPDCAQKLQELETPLPPCPSSPLEEAKESARKVMNSARFDAFYTGALVVLLLALGVIVTLFALCQIHIPVSQDKLELTVAAVQDSATTQGEFYLASYWVEGSPGVVSTWEQQGDVLYLTSKRPILDFTNRKQVDILTSFCGIATEPIREIRLNGSTVWTAGDSSPQLDYLPLLEERVQAAPEGTNYYALCGSGLCLLYDNQVSFWSYDGQLLLEQEFKESAAGGSLALDSNGNLLVYDSSGEVIFSMSFPAFGDEKNYASTYLEAYMEAMN